LGGGGNVPDRWGSDLWVHGSYAYTGTWGAAPRNGVFGNAIKIWQIGAGGPVLADSVIIPNVHTVSDLQVSDDGELLVVSTERETGQGLQIYRLTQPAKPAFLGEARVDTGLHTVSLFRIGGRLFAFAAKDPDAPALTIYDVTPP
jgi:hypothetical protein